MPKDTVVIDLDGTLADVSHRLPLIHRDHPDYRSFFARVGGDALNDWCRALIKALADDYRVVLVSGRPESTRDDTVAWLERHGVPYHELHLVRRQGDFTPDHELKRRWLRGYGKDRILFSVDDRQAVVDMWREEGIVCLQCNAWKEFKRRRGPALRLKTSEKENRVT
jgi:hypothetical protein